jgi:hypothetical protein
MGHKNLRKKMKCEINGSHAKDMQHVKYIQY